MLYIIGIKDGKKRQVCHIPVDGEKVKTFSPNSNRHCRMLLELAPGQFVKQMINQDRVKVQKVNKYGRLIGA